MKASSSVNGLQIGVSDWSKSPSNILLKFASPGDEGNLAKKG